MLVKNISVDSTQVGYSPESRYTSRPVKAKLSDTISPKDFGAIGDGLDHPLSEVFSTLTLAKEVYPFVTSLSQTQDYAGIQAAVIAAEGLNAGVLIPSGNYIINTTISVGYAASISGEGGQGLLHTDPNLHLPSPVPGTRLTSKVVSGHCISVSPRLYTFGLTLRDFAIWGVEGECDRGLYIHNIGWMGILEGINIQNFPNQAMEIGYIQDTYIHNCTFLESGSLDYPAVTMMSDSNYVYFLECHFEITPYMIKFGNPWFVFFEHCHFEVARASGGTGVTERFAYVSAPINLGEGYRIFFSNNVFIPTDVGYLANTLGVSRADVPYFITGSGSVISFIGDTFLAPEGTIKNAYLSGSDVDFIGVKFIRCDPSSYSLVLEDGKVSDCSVGIDASADTTSLSGIIVRNGSISNTKFGFYAPDSAGRRTEGALIVGAAHCSGNFLPMDSRINIFLDSGATVNGFDGGAPFFVDIPSSGDVNLTRYHPAANFRITSSYTAITHIYGSPYGRELIITSNEVGGQVAYAPGNLIPRGRTNLTLTQYFPTVWRCINDGSATVYQVS